MKNEMILAFNELLDEKGLPKDIIQEALNTAVVSAYRKSVNASAAQMVQAEVNLEKGEIKIFAEKEVVEEVQDERTEVTLEEAQKYHPEVKLDEIVMVESTPADFGRVAAQTARQVIQQKIRDAEHNAQMAYYEKQLGEIVSGTVQAANAQGLTIGLEMKAEGIMPRKEMIMHEHFRIHERVRALVAEVKESGRGPQIILSRTHRDFLRRLLENEVPEIFHGVVELRSIAREPGQRAKIAVSATQQGIDPVGACVGMRGVRIQAIVRELHDEKIDVIEWSQDPTVFIAKAISPARVSGVYLNDTSEAGKTALVVVPEDQLSLAIGRDGQNARLAAKLTGWRIDIKSLIEAATDWLNNLQHDAALKETADTEKENIAKVEDILARKAEGRTVNADDNEFVAKWVNGLERGQMAIRLAKRKAREKLHEDALQSIPTGAFDLDFSASKLSEEFIAALAAAEITNPGKLALIFKTEPEKIKTLANEDKATMKAVEKFINRLAELAPQPEPQPIIPSAEESATLEPTAETADVGQAAIESPAQVVSAEGEPEPVVEVSFAEAFTLKSDILQAVATTSDDEESEEGAGGDKKKKKKQKKFREITYDPDLDMTIVRKKHKDGSSLEDWES